MAESLQTPDGTALDGKPVDAPDPDREFSKAMAAPEPDEKQAPAPPPKDPEAPYGRRADGTPKRGPGGRPPRAKAPKEEKPRVQRAAPGKDYREELHGLVSLGWGVLAATSPADAAALKVHGPGMVEAWAELAKTNAQVARGLEWLTTGSAYGAVVMATAPLVMQVLVNHRRLPGERLQALGVQDPAVLTQITADDVAMMQEAAAATAAAA